MNTQAEQVRAYVNELKSLVGGSKEKRAAKTGRRGTRSEAAANGEALHGSQASEPWTEQQPGGPAYSPAFSAREQPVGGVNFQKGNGGSHHQTKTVGKSPRENIPFDKGDF
jgi:hypothetical protein